jgi:hypothetical protein
MTSYTTRTAEFGQITFTAPASSESYAGYVFVDINGKRRQICYGGDFLGSTITAKAGDLKATAQKWLRQRRELQPANIPRTQRQWFQWHKTH